MDSNNNSPHNYRTWPIFLLAFIRLFYVSIFERGLSNYLLYDIGIRESTLGFISSAGAITYIFAPILGIFLTKKFLGVRKALILNSILTPLLTGVQILYPEAWFLIICRVSLGLSMGLFWPNCLNLLSKWQKVSTLERSKKNFGAFNFSWNFGFIGGLLVGFVWTLFLSDYFAMMIAWILSFSLIPVSFFIKGEEKSENGEEPIIYQTEDPLSHLDIEQDLKINPQTPMIIYPILFSWAGIAFLTISKSIFNFGYPILLKDFFPVNTPSFMTYLVQGGMQLMQLGGLTWINSMKIIKRKTASLISVLLVMVGALAIILVGNIWYISVITAVIGLFLGLIHGTGMKIMLEYGTAKNTTKYSTINEILIGAGFGITPIITGYVVETQIYAIHVFVIILGIFIFLFLLYISRNVKKDYN
ncbi:MAG: MFS transporter [Promethearchaeota archaeon]